jgi:hypothetical protein
MLVDKNSRYVKRPVVLEPCIFFGQLQHILLVSLPTTPTLGLNQPATFILATIRTCYSPHVKGVNGVYYYSREGSLEVVDMDCVQCLVGRVRDSKEWAIIDRSLSSARPVFVTEEG